MEEKKLAYPTELGPWLLGPFLLTWFNFTIGMDK